MTLESRMKKKLMNTYFIEYKKHIEVAVMREYHKINKKHIHGLDDLYQETALVLISMQLLNESGNNISNAVKIACLNLNKESK